MDIRQFLINAGSSKNPEGLSEILAGASRIRAASLAWIAPLTCVVCAGSVEFLSPWPLCSACAELLTIDGNRRCDVCGKPIVSEQTRCMRCRSSEVSFDAAFPLYAYNGIARRLLIAYKSKKRHSLAVFLASRLAPEILARFPGYTLVPVPPRQGKIRKEGWDQVELLAGLIEHRYKWPVARILVRIKGGDEQKTLDREGRRMNMVGRYALKPRCAELHRIQSRRLRYADCGSGYSGPTDLLPGKILLLDDIMTTGATLSECASVLKAHGSSRVCAIVLAAD
jgi:competence protein ComFC